MVAGLVAITHDFDHDVLFHEHLQALLLLLLLFVVLHEILELPSHDQLGLLAYLRAH